MQTDKRCSRCGHRKELDEFPRNRSKKSGRESECHTCKRRRDIRRTFGITLEQYEEMNQTQGGVCAICLLPERSLTPSGKRRRLAVDHNHQTGRVRALLCRRCNQAIGALQENPKLLIRAAAYALEHTKCEPF